MIEAHIRTSQKTSWIPLAKQRGIYKGRKKGTKKPKPEEIRDLRKTLTVTQKDVTPRTVYNALSQENA